MGVPARDFIDRDALVKDAESGVTTRQLVGLRRNEQDVTGVVTSLMSNTNLPDQMEIPRSRGPHFGHVLVEGDSAGAAMGRTVSPTLRAMISLCVLDPAHTTPGTEVTVLWGRPGTPQREIRATVTSLPFKPDNRRTDVTAL